MSLDLINMRNVCSHLYCVILHFCWSLYCAITAGFQIMYECAVCVVCVYMHVCCVCACVLYLCVWIGLYKSIKHLTPSWLVWFHMCSPQANHYLVYQGQQIFLCLMTFHVDSKQLTTVSFFQGDSLVQKCINDVAASKLGFVILGASRPPSKHVIRQIF